MSSDRRGFSLAELVVSLSILALTAAAVVPALTRLAPEDDLAGSADRLATLLRGARARALASGGSVTLLLNPAARRFAIASREPGSDQDSVIADGVIALADGVDLRSGTPRVRLTFDGAGLAVPDTLTLATGQRRISVWADRWTGEIRLSQDGAAR